MRNKSVVGPTITFSDVAARISEPPKVNDPAEIRRLALVAARAADDAKALDVIVLDVGPTLLVTDLFVIASASNPRLVRAIVDRIEEEVKAAGGPGPVSVEGLAEASWVLLDYAGFVVHVFADETRKFYDLERLFADSPKISF